MNKKRLQIEYIDTSNSILNFDWFAITIHLMNGFDIKQALLSNGYEIKVHEIGTEQFKQRISVYLDENHIFTMCLDPRNTTCYKNENICTIQWNNIWLYDKYFYTHVYDFLHQIDYKKYYINEIHFALDNCDDLYKLNNRIIHDYSSLGTVKTKYTPRTADGKGRIISAAIMNQKGTFENIRIGSHKTGFETTLYNKSSDLKKKGKTHIIKVLNDIGVDYQKTNSYRFEMRFTWNYLKKFPLFFNSIEILNPETNNAETFFRNIFNNYLEFHDNKYLYQFKDSKKFEKLEIQGQETNLNVIKMFLRYEIVQYYETSDALHYDQIVALLKKIGKCYDKPLYFLEKVVERLKKDFYINRNWNLYIADYE